MATFHEGLWGEEDAQREALLSSREAQQAHDTYILQQAKEILCRLWLADRVSMECRTAGEAALAAAVHAIEWPGLRKIGMGQGKGLALQQWRRAQEQDHDPF